MKILVDENINNVTVDALEMDGRFLRVILLADRGTVHNAFIHRSFKP